MCLEGVRAGHIVQKIRHSAPSVVVVLLVLLPRILELQGSNLGSETGTLTEGFRVFPEHLYANVGLIP
jgi:hypothetical protein